MPIDIEQSVGFLLAKTHQRLYNYFRCELAPYGLTAPQFALLAFLWQRDGLSQTELSGLTEIDRSTLGGLLDRLQGAGLLERRPHPADRRAFLIHLTAAGQALEGELMPIVLRVRQHFFDKLSTAEYQELSRLLKKLRE